MKKYLLVLGLLLVSILGTSPQLVAQEDETYPSLGYFPDPKVPVEYEVQAGDFLGKIAKRFKITIEILRRGNLKLAMTDDVKIGDTLKVYPPKVDGLEAPAGTVQYADNSSSNAGADAKKSTDDASKKKGKFIEYQVQQGDTLYSLGKKFKVGAEKIRRANLVLAMTDHIEPGQVIKIPIVEE